MTLSILSHLCCNGVLRWLLTISNTSPQLMFYSECVLTYNLIHPLLNDQTLKCSLIYSCIVFASQNSVSINFIVSRVPDYIKHLYVPTYIPVSCFASRETPIFFFNSCYYSKQHLGSRLVFPYIFLYLVFAFIEHCMFPNTILSHFIASKEHSHVIVFLASNSNPTQSISNYSCFLKSFLFYCIR